MSEGTEGDGRGISTRAVHTGEPAMEVGAPVVNPIYQTTTFYSDPSGAGEVLYTRYGNNPNHRRVEARLRSIEGADECLVTASGISAMVAALLGCVRAGDHILAARALYGGTQVLLDRELSRLGIESSYVDFSADGWRDAVRENTKVLLAETLSNPLLRFTDPADLAPVAREVGAAVVFDATFTPGTNFRTYERGADLVVHSATKYFGGHSDVTAGVVCGRSDLMRSVADRARIFGAALDPHAAWLLERGIKTLPLRMQRHNENGLAVARWASEQPEIARVHYPGLDTHPDHAAAAERLNGFGGMMSIELRGGDEASDRFVRALRLAKVAPSLGSVETLVSEPRRTSHVALTRDERRAQGIGDGFIRFSLGIEDAADLTADIRRALDAAG
ncbi:MAG TPA: aminotransferase class I/II-fold pyridoxal phosphate-dependent enzyme [Longimicrobiaceae bacterium]|nr:aminotransferase class I/II-fold pyridoxal phosphate-dependent enzyme [Longimicrobiaceae bacterium]